MLSTMIQSAVPHRLLTLATCVCLGFFLAGCNKTPDKPAPKVTEAAHDEHDGHDHTGHDHAAHGHDAWWCPEHGVPEEVCAQCDSKLVADFKTKNDWCKEHDRPDSQCFICHPEHQAAFSELYVAKYGKQPPALTE